MHFGNIDKIYAGTDSVSKVFLGTDLIWPQSEPVPAWPSPYFYPKFGTNTSGTAEGAINKGLGFFLNLQSGDSIYYEVSPSTCDTSEWSDAMLGSIDSADTPIKYHNIYVDGTSLYNSYVEYTIIQDFNNIWYSFGDDYHFTLKQLNSGFTSCTAMWYKRRKTETCSNPMSMVIANYSNTQTGPFKDIYSNIRLLVDLTEFPIDSTEIGVASPSFAELVEIFPNLQYIALNKNGTNTGQTITLTGSTAWTADSMKFTEWNCPGTTFIIENNSWWRSRIDWEIAAERNITFKDSNGNIITQ